MRIGLSLLHARPGIGGGWNYMGNLVAALGKYDTSNTYIAYVNQQSRHLVPDEPNFETRLVNINPNNRFLRVAYENLLLPLLMRDQQLDCVHWFGSTVPLFSQIPSLVTIYDLKVFFRGKPSIIQEMYLRWAIQYAAHKASTLLPISCSTEEELLSVFEIDPSRLHVVPVVIDESFRPRSHPDTLAFCGKHDLPSRFWLYVAHFYPHKNHRLLIEAYHQLRSSNFEVWPLVLRGGERGAREEVLRRIKRLGLEEDVIFLPQLEYSELPLLYSSAAALIFPSLYEGAGIPVGEAMACGCPVVASDIPAVREFAGEAANYFDPEDISSILDTVKAFQRNEENRQEKIQIGLDRSRRHKPDAVVDILIDAYRQTTEQEGRHD